MIRENLLSSVNKIYGLKYDPYQYEDELEINIHILELYRLMIASIEPKELINIMIPKL